MVRVSTKMRPPTPNSVKQCSPSVQIETEIIVAQYFDTIIQADGFRFLAYEIQFYFLFLFMGHFLERKIDACHILAPIKRFSNPLIAIFNLFVPIDFVFFEHNVFIVHKNN